MNEQGVAERVLGLGKGEGNARWWGGGLATIKATSRETGGLYSVVEVLEPRGARAPLHLHRKEDEAFYVLEGEVTFQVGEETIRARPGSFVFGPKDVPHAYAVDSGPARLLFLLSPPGFEGFVEAVSKPARALTLPPSEPDEDEAESEDLAVLEARYGCEIVGTPSGHQPSRDRGKGEAMNEDHASRTYGLGEGGGRRGGGSEGWPPSRPRASRPTVATRSSRCSSPRASNHSTCTIARTRASGSWRES